MPRSGGRVPDPEGVREQKAPVRSRHQVAPDLLPQSKPDEIKPPTWLKADGRGIWKRLAPLLTASKLLTPIDRETFGRYCRNFARWLKMQTELDGGAETYTVKTESGEVHRVRPEFMIADRIERQLLAIEDRFGLNPAERQRIFLARAQSSSLAAGDLFGQPSAPRRSDDPASRPAEPSDGDADDREPIAALQ